jgi:uncharacterized protein YkwD
MRHLLQRPLRVARPLTGILLIAALGTAATAFAATGVTAPSVVRQTNVARLSQGLGGLTVDPSLARAAQAKADDMASRGYFGHRTPEGVLTWDLITRSGYEFTAAAENLAVGYSSIESAVTAWLASPGHRHNLLNHRYTETGIGIAHGRYKGRDTLFIVQIFGAPRPATVTPSEQ